MPRHPRAPEPGASGTSQPEILMKRGFAVIVAALLFHIPATQASGQRPVTPTDSLRLRLDSLIQRVDSLRAVLARLQPGIVVDTMDPLARIRAAAAAAAGQAVADTQRVDTMGAQEFIGLQRNLSALNPEVSVTGNVFAFSRSSDADADNFVPREFEISFVSNLDPYSRAKVFVAHHTHGGAIEPFAGEDDEHEESESETEIEEGYVEWVNVVGGVGVTVGKFRQRFGKLNRWHAHALPGQQLPLPYLAFLGEEGLAQAGVSLHWLAPIHSGGTYELWGEITRSGNTLFGESNRPSVLGHLNAFWELSPATYFEIGLSGIAGSRAEDGLPDGVRSSGARMFGADFTFDWRPPARSRYQQLTVHGGAMTHRRTFDGADDLSAWGGFLQGEYKFSARWVAGARYEYTENPNDPAEDAWVAGPTLTWWQSEYVRLRTEYQVYRGPAERFGQLVFQATFAMGPHKHENY
jgi:hypothetical protein